MKALAKYINRTENESVHRRYNECYTLEAEIERMDLYKLIKFIESPQDINDMEWLNLVQTLDDIEDAIGNEFGSGLEEVREKLLNMPVEFAS